MALSFRGSRAQLTDGSGSSSWTSAAVPLPEATSLGDGVLVVASKRRDSGTLTMSDPDSRFTLLAHTTAGAAWAGPADTLDTFQLSMTDFPAAGGNAVIITVSAWGNRIGTTPLLTQQTTANPAVMSDVTTNGRRAGVAVAALGHPYYAPAEITGFNPPAGWTTRASAGNGWNHGSVGDPAAWAGSADIEAARPDGGAVSWARGDATTQTFHYGMTFVAVALDEYPIGAPPCRIFPREDGLGVGGGRIYPPPKSQQRSSRRFGYY